MNYLPGIIFSLLIALFVGFVFHFIKGGGFLRLLSIGFFSIVGFFLGHFIANNIGISFVKIGWVNLGFGLIGSLVFSLLAIWVTNLNFEK